MRYGVTLFVLALGWSMSAQAPVAQRFEAASIKPSASLSTSGGFRPLPDGVRGTNMPLSVLVLFAYDLPSYRLDGGPGWFTRDRFDVTAKAARPASIDELQLMVRTLLADRLGLEIRRESREVPVWALVKARSDGGLGPRLRACVAKCSEMGGSSNRSLGTMSETAIPIEHIVDVLASLVGGPVVDRSGLTGSFDIDLEWAPESSLDAFPDRPSLFTAVQEQLGLKLESSRGPMEVLVVERVERPTPD